MLMSWGRRRLLIREVGMYGEGDERVVCKVVFGALMNDDFPSKLVESLLLSVSKDLDT
jgi:hypothetical protein